MAKQATKPCASPRLFLLPYIIITAVFFLYPFLNAILLAFQQTNGPASSIWVGFKNFAFIFSDPRLYKALANTAVFAFFSIFLQLPLSLGLALLLNSKRSRSKGFFRLLIFSPHLVGQIFVGILFSVMFFPRYGLVNKFLYQLFLNPEFLNYDWLQNPTLIMPALVIISLWMYVGFNMIYFLAALQNVDETLKEAAQIDGASPWQIFWAVTFPAIKPITTFVVIMSTIGSFQLFELPFALLNSRFGPNDAGLTMVGYLYDHAFNNGDLGTGAAVGWVLTFVIFVISLIQIRISGTTREM